jgi:hypothetical protein
MDQSVCYNRAATIIHGNGSAIRRAVSAPKFHILAVATNGDLRLNVVTISSGSPRGIYNRGKVSLALAYQGLEVWALNASCITFGSRNLSGYSGNAGFFGFCPKVIDIVPPQPLGTILNTISVKNGGSIQTHAVIAGNPAIDAAMTVFVRHQLRTIEGLSGRWTAMVTEILSVTLIPMNSYSQVACQSKHHKNGQLCYRWQLSNHDS